MKRWRATQTVRILLKLLFRQTKSCHIVFTTCLSFLLSCFVIEQLNLDGPC